MNHCPIFEKIPVIKVFLQLHGTGKWAFMVISIAFHSFFGVEKPIFRLHVPFSGNFRGQNYGVHGAGSFMTPLN